MSSKFKQVIVVVLIAHLALPSQGHAAWSDFSFKDVGKGVVESLKRATMNARNLFRKKASYKNPLDDLPKKVVDQWADPILGKEGAVAYTRDAETGNVRSLTFAHQIEGGLSFGAFIEKFSSDLKINAENLKFEEASEPIQFADADLKVHRFDSEILYPGMSHGVPIAGGQLITLQKGEWVRFAQSTLVSDLHKAFPDVESLKPVLDKDKAIKFAKDAVIEKVFVPLSQIGTGLSGTGISGFASGMEPVKRIDTAIIKTEETEEDDVEEEMPQREDSLPVRASEQLLNIAEVDVRASVAVSTKNFSGRTADARLVWVVSWDDDQGFPHRVHIVANTANGGIVGEVANIEAMEFGDLLMEKNFWSKGVSLCGEATDQVDIVTLETVLGSDRALVNAVTTLGKFKTGGNDFPDKKLANPSMPAAIWVSNCRGKDEGKSKCLHYTEEQNTIFGDSPDENGLKEGVSVLFGLQSAAKYFCEKFTDPLGLPCWKGWDGFGKKMIKGEVYLADNIDRHRMIPSKGIIAFAATDDLKKTKNVCLASVGHEYMHGLLYRGGTTGRSEMDAIGEGYATFFGILIKAYALNQAPVWNYNGWFDLLNPKGAKLPDTFGGKFYVKEGCVGGGMCYQFEDEEIPCTSENCDPAHTNATVVAKALTMLAQKDGTVSQGENDLQRQYQVTGIGTEDTARIAFEALKILPANAKMKDLREATLSAARALFTEESPKYQSVMSAWAAVGIGAENVRKTLPGDGEADVDPWGDGKGALLAAEVFQNEDEIVIEVSTDRKFSPEKITFSQPCTVKKPMKAVDEFTACEVNVPLASDTAYFWRIRGKSSKQWDMVKEFKTAALKISASIPTPVHPWNVKVDWTELKGAKTYHVVIRGLKGDWANQSISKSDPAKEAVFPMVNPSRDETYEISVLARGPGEHQVESNKVTVTLDYTQTRPKPVSEGDVLIPFMSPQYAMQWAKVEGATGYYYTVKNLFTGANEKKQILSEEALIAPNTYLAGFQWQVEAIGPDGKEIGDPSDARTVKTELPIFTISWPGINESSSAVSVITTKTLYPSFPNLAVFPYDKIYYDLKAKVGGVCSLLPPAGIGQPPTAGLTPCASFDNTPGADAHRCFLSNLPPEGDYCVAVVASKSLAGQEAVVATTLPREFSVKSKVAICGNGKVEPGEQCDDGNQSNADTCDNTCQPSLCSEITKSVPATSCPGTPVFQLGPTANLCASPVQFGVQTYSGDQSQITYHLEICEAYTSGTITNKCSMYSYALSDFGSGSPIQLNPLVPWAWRMFVTVEGCQAASPKSGWRYFNCDPSWKTCPVNTQ